MKLSDIKGERALDVIADIIEPIANIAEDEKAKALFKTENVPDGEDAKKYAAKRLKKGVPALIKGHKDDILSVLAAINGKSVEEYANTFGVISLVRDVIELMTDDAFVDLFISAQTEKPSGSVQEATEAPEA